MRLTDLRYVAEDALKFHDMVMEILDSMEPTNMCVVDDVLYGSQYDYQVLMATARELAMDLLEVRPQDD